MRWLVVVALAGCGRFAFDELASDGGRSDAPALPGKLTCSATRLEIAPTMASELAVTPDGSGVTAMWLGSDGSVRGLYGDALTGAPTEVTFSQGPVDEIGGVLRTSITLLYVTRRGAMQSLWRLNGTGPGSFSDSIELRSETTVMAREPFINETNTGLSRTWIRGESGGIRATYVDDAGVLKSDTVLPTSNPVIGLSGANNDSHGHAAWSMDVGGGADCAQSDIDFPNGVAPVSGGGGPTASDCFAPRIDSGPPGTDSIATVFRAGAGTVEMAYFGSTVGTSKRLSEKGRAPKIKFDGTWFWVAWIDESGSADVLRLAKLAQDLTFDVVDIPGWTPAGDEAFELVKTTNGTVQLAVLGADTVSFLRTCP